MITLTIPDFIENAIKLPEKKKAEELTRLLAVKLYEKGIIGIGKAAGLCGISKLEFQALLIYEGVDLNYDDEELDRDLASLKFFE